MQWYIILMVFAAIIFGTTSARPNEANTEINKLIKPTPEIVQLPTSELVEESNNPEVSTDSINIQEPSSTIEKQPSALSAPLLLNITEKPDSDNKNYNHAADDFQPIEDAAFKSLAKRSLIPRKLRGDYEDYSNDDDDIDSIIEDNNAVYGKDIAGDDDYENTNDQMASMGVSSNAEEDDDDFYDDDDDEEEEQNYNADNVDAENEENNINSYKIADDNVVEPRILITPQTEKKLEIIPSKMLNKRRVRFRLRLPSLYGGKSRKNIQHLNPFTRRIAIMQKLNKRLSFENQRYRFLIRELYATQQRRLALIKRKQLVNSGRQGRPKFVIRLQHFNGKHRVQQDILSQQLFLGNSLRRIGNNYGNRRIFLNGRI